MMKKITLFIAICVSFMAQELIAQCIPTGVSTVFGTVTAANGTFTFNNMPTGTVVRLSAPAAGTFYTVSMCNTNGGVAQADGVDDSQLTILDVNSAAAVSLASNDDFCPTTGVNGFGPSQVSYTATASGDIFAYLTEWTATSANGCVADGANNTYTMTVTVTSAAPPCEAGTLTSPLTQVVCPGQTGTIASTGNSTPGDYAVGFAPGLTGTGGTGGAITLTGVATLPYTFDDDLNGVLSGQTTPLPPLAGEWILTLYAADGTTLCDSTATTSVTFAAASDPACGGTGIDAEITSVEFSEYTSVPLSQVGTYSPSMVVTNIGSSTVTNVTAAVRVLDGANATVYTASMNTVASLAAAGSTPLTDGGLGFTPSAIDFYLIEYIISITEVDGNTLNDTTFLGLDVTDSLFTRDFAALVGNAAITGALGIGVGGTVIAGNVIEITTPTNLVSIEAFFNGTVAIGDTLNAKLHAFSGNTVGAQLASIEKIITPADTPVFFLEFLVNQALAVGEYYVAIEETFTMNNMGLLYSPDIYTDFKTQGNINGGAFDDLGTLAGPAFRVVPLVRANVYAPPVATCSITNLVAGTQTSCIPATNAYSQDVTVTYQNAPATGMLNVNGQMFAIGTSPQTVTLTGLDSDGSAVNVTAAFTADAACTLTQNALFIAPANCQPVCAISALTAGAQTPCVNTNNTYTQEVVVTYSTPPATGMLSVNGQMFAITASPQTVTLTGLNSDGLAVNVSASFTANAACNFAQNALFTAPVSCLCPTINVNVTTVPNSNCSTPNGSATANVVGGAAIASFAWTPSNFGNGAVITGLPSGSYSVIVTDVNGCTGSGSGNVSNTAGVNAVVGNVVNPTCNTSANGVITISATGGTTPISYTWSDQGFATPNFSRSNLPAGSYTVIVTDNGGCSVNLGPIVLTAPAPLTAVLTSQTNVSCNGGNNGLIDMTVSGGTAPYTQTWSNSTATTTDLSALSAGTYQLSVVDANACPVVTGPQVTITEPSPISINVLGSTDVSCNGGSDGTVDVTVTGGTPGYTYNWGTGNPNAEDLSAVSAGTYQLVVTDANLCSATSASASVAEPTALVLATSSTEESSSAAGDGTASVSGSGGTAPYSFLWDDANAQTSATASNLNAGTYNVTVTDANACSETVSVVVDLGSGIKEITLQDFTVYPNPASKSVIVTFDVEKNTEFSVNFYNTIGNLLMTDNASVNSQYKKSFDVSNLAAGIYFVEIQSEAGKAIKKLTVTK